MKCKKTWTVHSKSREMRGDIHPSLCGVSYRRGTLPRLIKILLSFRNEMPYRYESKQKGDLFALRNLSESEGE